MNTKFLLTSLCLAGCLLFGAGKLNPLPPTEPGQPLLVILVRHAEKTDAATDPGLTQQGRDRAERLATLLQDSGIDHVHSSDFKRTRDTGAAYCAAHNLEIQLYDPAQLESLASRLKAMGGRHLVIGHSNTTPALVELLGGDGGTPIVEESEYDRMYIVTFTDEGASQSLLLRYGNPAARDK